MQPPRSPTRFARGRPAPTPGGGGTGPESGMRFRHRTDAAGQAPM